MKESKTVFTVLSLVGAFFLGGLSVFLIGKCCRHSRKCGSGVYLEQDAKILSDDDADAEDEETEDY